MRSKLMSLAASKRSRLILALDVFASCGSSRAMSEHVERLLEELRDIVVGVKIGLPLLLSLGVNRLKQLIADFRNDYYMLADFKLADVPHIMERSLERLSEMRFDGAILHLFPMGYERVAESFRGKLGMYGVALMSHRGCELLESSFDALLNYALKLRLDGVIVGATRLEAIKRARARLERTTLILSPGVGYQGGKEASALEAGADFEIVGRLVTLSANPRASVQRVVDAQRRALGL